MAYVALAALTMATAFFCLFYWSRRVYPTAEHYHYPTVSDIQLPHAQAIPLHAILARQYRLHETVAHCQTDFESVLALNHWVRQQLTSKTGRSGDSDNPLLILSRVRKGEPFSDMDHATVLSNSLMAVGIPTRKITGYTADANWRPFYYALNGIEYFDRQSFRWVWFDYRAGVRFISHDRPLNSLEIKDAMIDASQLIENPERAELDGSELGSDMLPFLAVIVAEPVGQPRKFALIPPALKHFRRRGWLRRNRRYHVRCQSTTAFFATPPLHALTEPVRTRSALPRQTSTDSASTILQVHQA